jgi:hypothetical protein
MLGISFLTEMAPRPSCSTDGARAAEGKSGGVLAFLKSEALHPADFTIREDAVVRLIRSWRGEGRGRQSDLNGRLQ